MRDSMLEAAFDGFDGPIQPPPEFEAQLWALLHDELVASAGAARRSRRVLRSALPRRRRRILIVLAALFAVAAVATAAFLAARAWTRADAPTPPPAPPTSVARAAEKAPVTLTLDGGPSGGNPNGGTGRFTLRWAGLNDRGEMTYSVVFPSSGTNADGQSYAVFDATIYVFGSRGRLVLALHGTSLGAVGDGAVTGEDVWQGEWRVLETAGHYRRLRGSGRLSGIAGPGARLALRLDGSMG